MDIEKQKAALTSVKVDVTSNILSLKSGLESYSNTDDSGSESDVPTDNADVASALFERERNESMLLEFEGRLEEVERALEKISEGTYGICDRDGKKITPERLIAIPEATLCIDCQALEEGL